MSAVDELGWAILECIRAEPGISCQRLARDFDMPVMQMLRELGELAMDDETAPGSALVALDRKSETSLVFKVRLTSAGEALWAS